MTSDSPIPGAALPDWQFVVAHPAHFVASGFGSGLSPVASGTAGTLVAWICYPLLRAALPDLPFAVFLAAALIVGIYVCDKTGRDLNSVDHGIIVWDEMVAFWLVLFLTPAGWRWQLAAFLLFRLFDIVKPPPAGFFDQKVHHGAGVMMDDVVAAGYSLLALALGRMVLP